jgi:hypothetical protein
MLAVLVVLGGATAFLLWPRDPLPPERPRTASLAELRGPWQPTPFVLDAAMRDRAVAACRREMAAPTEAGGGMVDARGGAALTVRLSGAGGALCQALAILPSGEIATAGGGQVGGLDPVGSPGPTELSEVHLHNVDGLDLAAGGWAVNGHTGSGITRVLVEAPGQRPMTATLENGVFGAWWPMPATAPGLGPAPLSGEVIVRGFDAAGVQRAEFRR